MDTSISCDKESDAVDIECRLIGIGIDREQSEMIYFARGDVGYVFVDSAVHLAIIKISIEG